MLTRTGYSRYPTERLTVACNRAGANPNDLTEAATRALPPPSNASEASAPSVVAGAYLDAMSLAVHTLSLDKGALSLDERRTRA